jgi:uncharacterized protein
MVAPSRQLLFAFLIVVSSVGLDLPAGAQLAGSRPAFEVHSTVEFIQFGDFWNDRGSSNRNNFFDPYWGDRRTFHRNNSYDPYNPFNRRPQPQAYESIKPPAPRKVETPPAETVLVIGDSLGEWLAYGLELAFAETPQIGIVRKIKLDLGLVRDDARLDAPEWTQAIKDLLPATEKPNAIVVMLGVNDRAPLRDRPPATKPSTTPPDSEHPPPATAAPQHPPPGASYEFHTDKWAELYAKRIDDMIAMLKTRGVPIIWVGLPAVRGAKATSDMGYLDELYRARADKAGIAYVDIWDGFVDDQGRFVQDGPDFEGQTRRLRTYDGVNFTKAGAEKLGHYVEHDLRRVLGSHVLPVALPGPEEQPPANDAVAGRPAVGPVVPLNSTNVEKGGQLLGAASQPTDADPLATRVLNRGEAIVAPRGRADDFSWPRRDISGTTDEALPDAVAPKGAAANSGAEDGKKSAEKAATTKSSEATNRPTQSSPTSRVTTARPRRHIDRVNDAPRPPLPIGPATSNWR